MKNLFAALAKAKSEIKKIGKDATNPFHKSKYATLEAVIEGTSKALEDAKICIVQFPEVKDGAYVLRTIISHESGEMIESYAPLPVKDPHDPQKLGSAITYLRRYTLVSILGLIVSDDDGQSAATPSPQNKPNEYALSYHQVEELRKLGYDNQDAERLILAHFKVKDWSKLPPITKEAHDRILVKMRGDYENN